jgi:hypothetical protein
MKLVFPKNTARGFDLIGWRIPAEHLDPSIRDARTVHPQVGQAEPADQPEVKTPPSTILVTKSGG